MNMFDLLDSAISETEARRSSGGPSLAPGNSIVSVNNDASLINWVAGMSDPGEMIACGAYQELRRVANESDTDYAARLAVLLKNLPEAHRAKIMAAGVTAASRRAALDFSAGYADVVVAGLPAWHGLGTNVKNVMTSAEVQQLALNWRVAKQEVQYMDPTTNTMRVIKDKYVIVRQDTGAALGTVGSVYKPFQNSEAFQFLDTLLPQFGAKYESAGSLYGGRKIWALVHLPKQAFRINGKDAIEPYAIFTNTHDGSEAAACHPTVCRTVCGNTFRQAGKEKGKGIAIRHTTNLKEAVRRAAEVLGATIHQVDEFKHTAEVMAHTKIDPKTYFRDVLDHVCDVTEADALKGADALAAAVALTTAERKIAVAQKQRQINERERLLEDLLTRQENETNGMGGMRGTVWGAFNTATESADHGRLGGRQVGDDKASRKFDSVLTGAADAVKQVAYQVAMQTMNA